MADREEIADKLRKRFPELPEREIEITLEQCNYDLDRAIKALEVG
jgi:NACalpha-BTF3-like transcription factor